jgi:hypothetical protein
MFRYSRQEATANIMGRSFAARALSCIHCQRPVPIARGIGWTFHPTIIADLQFEIISMREQTTNDIHEVFLSPAAPGWRILKQAVRRTQPQIPPEPSTESQAPNKPTETSQSQRDAEVRRVQDHEVSQMVDSVMHHGPPG